MRSLFPPCVVGLVGGACGLLAACTSSNSDDASISTTQRVMFDSRRDIALVYQRLAGKPAEVADIDRWAAELDAALDRKAYLVEVVARAAVAQDSFYSVTVVAFAKADTSKDGAFHPSLTSDGGAPSDAVSAFNDVTATIVGLVRDDRDYRDLLSADVLYVPTGTAYSPTDNTEYDRVYANALTGAPLAPALSATTQSGATGLPLQAGVFTLRGYGAASYAGGTNRAPVRVAARNYLCRDMEDLSDTSLSDPYVRRDVDRAPGGDPVRYRTECAACHTGLDPLSKAFSYLDFARANGSSGGRVNVLSTPAAKMNKDADVFPGGAVVADDAWVNLWLKGSNASLGWDPGRMQGNGPRSFGEMIAASKMFPACMAQRAYRSVCRPKGALSAQDKSNVAALTSSFEQTFRMKRLFKEAAAKCVSP